MGSGKWNLEMFLKVLRIKKMHHWVSWFPLDDTYHVIIAILKLDGDKLNMVSDEYGNFKRPAYLDVRGRETEVLEDVRNFNDAYKYLFGD